MRALPAPSKHPPARPLLSRPPQGYMVGNGCTDAEFDGNAVPPFAVGKSLISQARRAGVLGRATPADRGRR